MECESAIVYPSVEPFWDDVDDYLDWIFDGKVKKWFDEIVSESLPTSGVMSATELVLDTPSGDILPSATASSPDVVADVSSAAALVLLADEPPLTPNLKRKREEGELESPQPKVHKVTATAYHRHGLLRVNWNTHKYCPYLWLTALCTRNCWRDFIGE